MNLLNLPNLQAPNVISTLNEYRLYNVSQDSIEDISKVAVEMVRASLSHARRKALASVDPCGNFADINDPNVPLSTPSTSKAS